MDEYSDDEEIIVTPKRNRDSDSDSEEFRPTKKLRKSIETPPDYFEKDLSELRISIVKHVLQQFTPEQRQAFAYKINNGVKEALELFQELVEEQFESLITSKPTENMWKLGLSPNEIKKYGQIIKNLRKANKDGKITIKKIVGCDLEKSKKANLLTLYDSMQTMDSQSVEYALLTSEINEALKKASAKKLNPKKLETEKTLKALIGQDKPLKERILDADIDDKRKAAIYEKYLLLQKTPDDSVTAASLEEWIEEALKTPFTKVVESVIDTNPGQALVKLKRGFEEHLSEMDTVLEPLLTIFNNRLHNPDSSSLVIGLLGSPGVGKCLAYNTPVLMFDGSVKMVQDIGVGDQVMGDDSKARNVIGLGRGQELMYWIRQKGAEDYRVNSSHILSLMSISNPKITDHPSENFYLLEWFTVKGKQRKFYTYRTTNKKEIKTEIDNYATQLPGRGSIIDISIQEYLWRTEEWKSNYHGYKVGVEYPEHPTKVDPYQYGSMLIDGFAEEIADEYMINSQRVRREIFKGIVSKCTSKSGICYSIHRSNEKLARSIRTLARSLGFRARIDYYRGSPKRPGKNASAAYYRVYVHADIDFVTYEIEVCEDKVDYYYGFEIDNNRRFVLGDYTVTHNTAVGQVIAKVWGLPFAQISLGGVVDSSILDGQHSGWVGSNPGRFAKALQEMGAINGIIFLDEIDKLGSTARGMQVQYSLLHSTDPVQNKAFIDHYLGSKLPLDLSKCLKICALNKTDGLDPALLNRMHIIKVPDYTQTNKKTIMRKHLFPNALKNIALEESALILTEEGLDAIITKVEDHEGKQGGVRGVKAAIHIIVDKLNLLFRTSVEEQAELGLSFTIPTTKPLKLTADVVEKLYNPKSTSNSSWSMMYS